MISLQLEGRFLRIRSPLSYSVTDAIGEELRLVIVDTDPEREPFTLYDWPEIR